MEEIGGHLPTSQAVNLNSWVTRFQMLLFRGDQFQRATEHIRQIDINMVECSDEYWFLSE